MKRLRSLPQTRKQRKYSEKQVFGTKTSRYSSKLKFLNSMNCELLFALLTSNITYMKRLWSMAAEKVSTDEKTVKNSEKPVLAPKLAVTCSKFKCLNSKFESQSVWNSKTTLHTQHTSSSNPFSSYTTRQTRSANKQNSKKISKWQW